MAQNTVPSGERNGPRSGLGIVLIIVGALFLLAQVFGISIWSTAWPAIVIVIGAAFFVAMLAGGKRASGLAIPGSIITTVGLILAYQEAFNRHESWSYAWALIVASVGIGNMIRGFWTDDPKSFQGGLRLAGIGATMFVVFGAFFELIIFAGAGSASVTQWFWPVALILLGAVVLYRSSTRRGSR
jgi:drug/metabolite transporter (DMT)-like permease